MSSWTKATESGTDLQRYSPRDLTDSKDFSKDLREIDRNQTLSVMDKYKAKKALMRTVFEAKQMEIGHYLESYENYLLARKDVEAKAITLEAQKAIMVLEKEQLEMMKEMGLAHSDEISSTLIKAGEMLTDKLHEVQESEMLPDIKVMVVGNIRNVWQKTNKRILESVDTYMDELYEKERGR
ncbi:MAG: hypothetical protein EH225_05285 [Calditrichaeota bacterium]|nr:hypothetical protein [Spirochaetales bacterium]RQW04865.1 MAG: hypothetical protein EH225_05285 [Calditrichota bacterium]